MRQVIIFGENVPEWSAALNEKAPVWHMVGASARTLPGLAASELDQVDEETIVIPLMEKHIVICPKRFRSLFPPKQTVNLLSDKRELSQYLASHQLQHLAPTTFTLENIQFPCVVKRLNLNAGTGVEVATDEVCLSHILTRNPWAGHPVIIQEYIASEFDFVTHAVCRGGHFIWSCTYQLSVDPPGAIQRPSNTIAREKLEASIDTLRTLESLIAPLAYDGPINFDYKLTKHGLRIMEINPRLGGSLIIPDNIDDLAGALRAICLHSYTDHENKNSVTDDLASCETNALRPSNRN